MAWACAAPETASIVLHLEVVERVHLHIKIQPASWSRSKEPSEGADKLAALQARIAALEAELEKQRLQKEVCQSS